MKAHFDLTYVDVLQCDGSENSVASFRITDRLSVVWQPSAIHAKEWIFFPAATPCFLLWSVLHTLFNTRNSGLHLRPKIIHLRRSFIIWIHGKIEIFH